jgi:hypothetical protein
MLGESRRLESAMTDEPTTAQAATQVEDLEVPEDQSANVKGGVAVEVPEDESPNIEVDGAVGARRAIRAGAARRGARAA